MRRSLVVAITLLAITFLFVGGPSLLFSPSTSDIAPEEEEGPDPEIVSFEDSESGFWPYLNAREAHERRSPINVVVRGDANETVRLLAEHGEGDYEETDDDHFDADEFVQGVGDETAEPDETGGATRSADVSGDGVNETEETNETLVDVLRPISPTEIPWSQAKGATRYAYLDPGPGGEAYWTTETLQLEDGEYYSYRYHIRAYQSPNPGDRWIVMQTHSEHFDWFTLRHRVDGVERAQTRLEADLMAIPGVDVQEDVERIYLGNDGPSDSNGWATKVDLTAGATAVESGFPFASVSTSASAPAPAPAPASAVAPALALIPLLVGLAARRDRDGATVVERATRPIDDRLTETDRARLRAAADRLEARHLILAATILAVILGVRIAGVALDRTVDSFDPHTIAALLYPLIAVGLPGATYVVASGLERRLDAAVVASLSFVTAIWLDYALLGVDVLPVDVVLQRMFVVVALGLIAGGAARRATRESRLNDLLLVGVVVWVLVLVGTLLGYL